MKAEGFRASEMGGTNPGEPRVDGRVSPPDEGFVGNEKGVTKTS